MIINNAVVSRISFNKIVNYNIYVIITNDNNNNNNDIVRQASKDE